MRNIGWGKALWVLLRGGPEIIGKGYKWKSGLLLVAIVTSLTIPVIVELIHSQYVGKLPPEVPIIKATGTLEDHKVRVGKTWRHYATFVADDGRVFQFGDDIVADYLKPVTRISPPLRINVEGFILADGRMYWPTTIRTLDGRDIVSPDDLSELLMRLRNPWQVYLVMYSFSSVLWIISLFNAAKIRKVLKDGKYATE